MVDLPHPAPPAPEISTSRRIRAALDMWFVDHGFIRDIYCNIRKVSDQAYRSAQPSPHHLAWAKKKGIKTIINLRGTRETCGSYILEREACERLGLTLVDYPIRSRSALEPATLLAAKTMFADVEYPILMHCKSGADRAGFMSTLYLFLHEKVDLTEARKHLSLRYGHIKQAKTGVIDFFLDRFQAETKGRPEDFTPWVSCAYDRDKLNASFQEGWLAGIIVNKILRRE